MREDLKPEDIINRDNMRSQLRNELIHVVEGAANRNEGMFKFESVGMNLYWEVMTDTLLELAANSMAHQALFHDAQPEDFFPKMSEWLEHTAERAYSIIYHDRLSGKQTRPTLII